MPQDSFGIPTVGGGKFSRMLVYTSSGTYVKPANLKHIVVEAVGGGASGGSGSGGSNWGSGGGAGAGFIKFIEDKYLFAVETIVVAAAGGYTYFGTDHPLYPYAGPGTDGTTNTAGGDGGTATNVDTTFGGIGVALKGGGGTSSSSTTGGSGGDAPTQFGGCGGKFGVAGGLYGAGGGGNSAGGAAGILLIWEYTW